MMFRRCPWYVAGPLFGALVVGLRAVLNKPFGALGGYIDLAEHAHMPSRLGYRAYLIAGVALGGTLFALLTGAFVPTFAYTGGLVAAVSPGRFGLLALAGVAIGFGARTAGGCTSGHGVSGTSLGSPASFVATTTFFATAVFSTYVFTWMTASW